MADKKITEKTISTETIAAIDRAAERLETIFDEIVNVMLDKEVTHGEKYFVLGRNYDEASEHIAVLRRIAGSLAEGAELIPKTLPKDTETVRKASPSPVAKSVSKPKTKPEEPKDEYDGDESPSEIFEGLFGEAMPEEYSKDDGTPVPDAGSDAGLLFGDSGDSLSDLF